MAKQRTVEFCTTPVHVSRSGMQFDGRIAPELQVREVPHPSGSLQIGWICGEEAWSTEEPKLAKSTETVVGWTELSKRLLRLPISTYGSFRRAIEEQLVRQGLDSDWELDTDSFDWSLRRKQDCSHRT